MAKKIKAKLALQLREAGVSANKIYEAHQISKKSQKYIGTGVGSAFQFYDKGTYDKGC